MQTQKIVIVDDDPAYLEVMQEVLQYEGYRNVVCLGDAQDFATIEREEPTLVLLDISPYQIERDWQLLECLRTHPQTKHVPVLVCSTNQRLLRDKQTWFTEHNCDVIDKPFMLDEFLEKVTTLMASPENI